MDRRIRQAIAPLEKRRFHPEIMDQSGLDVAEHRRALRGLQRLNRLSRAARLLWNEIALVSRARRLTRVNILDIASGGGDVPLALWRRARRSGLELRICGLDISPTACQFAADRCAEAQGAIRFQQSDVTRDAFPSGNDLIICSLFLHHLTATQATDLLKRMAVAADVVVVSDLRRCAAGYALAQLACRIVTRSPIVRLDGPQSVANAFTLSEARELCAAAGLAGAAVRAAWPGRLMIVHQKSK